MKFFVCIMLLALCAAPVIADTGPVEGTPGNYTLIDIPIDAEIAPVTGTHVEGGDLFKGWYAAVLTNKSTVGWAGMKIEAIGPGVYIVQGTGLTDEWGIVGNSVFCNKPATATYSASAGNVSYGENGELGTGTLHQSAYFSFASPIAGNSVGKVGFKIYTDNTAYENGSFGVKFTPTVVPEPSALVAMLSGFVGMMGFAVRRRK